MFRFRKLRQRRRKKRGREMKKKKREQIKSYVHQREGINLFSNTQNDFTLKKARAKGVGMRWTRTGGQTILTLRSLLKSGRWETFWSLYKTARFTPLPKTAT